MECGQSARCGGEKKYSETRSSRLSRFKDPPPRRGTGCNKSRGCIRLEIVQSSPSENILLLKASHFLLPISRSRDVYSYAQRKDGAGTVRSGRASSRCVEPPGPGGGSARCTASGSSRPGTRRPTSTSSTSLGTTCPALGGQIL